METKKCMAILLAFAVCLGMCACGNGGKPAAGEEAPEISPSNPANPNLDHPLVSQLYGTWSYSGEHLEEQPFASLVVAADGTCTVDGVEGNWTVSERSEEDKLFIEILVDDQLITEAGLYSREDRIYFYALEVIYPGDKWVNKEAKEAAEAELLEDWGHDLYGQWEILYRDDQGKLPAVIFYEDRTVQIGEECLSWEIGEGTEYLLDEIELYIHADGEARYEMKLSRREGDLYAWITPADGEEMGLYKPSYYETVEITVENIYDYFEMVTFWEEEYNGFNELNMVKTYPDFVLKDPYASRVSYLMADSWDYNVLDSGAIEWSYKVGSFDVILNDDHTFDVENCIAEDEYTGIQPGGGTAGEKYHFGVPYTFGQYVPGEDLDVENWRGHNDRGYYGFEVLRVNLTLYLIPEDAE